MTLQTLRPTPIEQYTIMGVPIHVKREDLCWGFPPLSKARGVWAAIQSRPNVNLAVVDTGRSLNGQLVSTIGLTLGRKVLCGYPVYKADPDRVPGPALLMRSLGVETVGLPANRQFVMRTAMERVLAGKPGEWFLLPTGLRLPETVDATEEQARLVVDGGLAPKTVVVPSGTGTHLAGLLRVFGPMGCRIVATMGYSRKEKTFRSYVWRAAFGSVLAATLRPERSSFEFVPTDAGYYEAKPNRLPPWPAHLNYECRAFNWLGEPGIVESLPQPILFWNIGA